jgi:soluble lytic murein transglycosylase-like protein
LFAVFDGHRLWPRSGTGPVSLPQLAARRSALEPLVQRIASLHGVQAALLKAVIEVESGFNAQARSPKGAIGLMQVMPATAARYGDFDLYSPEQNLDVGTRYLRDLLAMFNGNVQLAVAAYNAGENAVLRSGRRVPAYPETQRYVPMVLERYNRFQSHQVQ